MTDIPYAIDIFLSFVFIIFSALKLSFSPVLCLLYAALEFLLVFDSDYDFMQAVFSSDFSVTGT
jgi:hypothetical protein